MITVSGVNHSLGMRRVLRDMTFAVGVGITGFLGPNGAGKTTTLRIISALLTPDEGDVSVCGFDVRREPREVHRSIGLLTEEPGLYDRLTVWEQLAFAGGAHGLGGRRLAQRIEWACSLLGLSARMGERAATLSKGTRQKVALARALIHDPPVLLLDEPTSSLDVETATAVQDVLRGPEFDGRTVLLSTHMLEEAERLCGNIVGIDAGCVVAQGTVGDICKEAGDADFRRAFLSLLTRSRGT